LILISQIRGFAFVTLASKEEAKAAIEKFNGLDFKGQVIDVQMARRNGPRNKTPGKYLGRGKRRHSYRGYDPGDQGAEAAQGETRIETDTGVTAAETETVTTVTGLATAAATEEIATGIGTATTTEDVTGETVTAIATTTGTEETEEGTTETEAVKDTKEEAHPVIGADANLNL